MWGGRRSHYSVIDDDVSSLLPVTQQTLVDVPTVHNEFGGPPESHQIPEDDQEPFERFRHLSGDGMAVSGMMDHRWQHIDDLDQFFTRVYEYHQGGGFMCISVKHLLGLVQFLFVVFFSTFLLQCVDYNVLFNNRNMTTEGRPLGRKITVRDAIIDHCSSHLHPLVVLSLLLAVVFWMSRLVRVVYHLLQLYEIRQFYSNALRISEAELGNCTWHSVLQGLCQVQPRLHLIINRDELTALDVYQRILRFKNYFVAMVNKEILPPSISLPFLGRVPYLPNGLKINLEWLLFWGQWSPWNGPYALKEEYKHQEYTDELTRQMERTILWMGIFNLIFLPVVFLYQILYGFFSYAELIKREPGALGTRRYSNYGRARLRHMNELEHELRGRLNRSHQWAAKYLEQFVSPLSELMAKNIAFVAGAVFAVLALLSAWDEDVLTVEHVLTLMTVCGVVVMCCRSFIQDENLVWCPEALMKLIISNVHYAPDSWRGFAHTERVRSEFSNIFHLKIVFVLEELLSPILTPFILLFWLRPRSREMVTFFREYTVNVVGLGDVCSFAQMVVATHGDPQWNGDVEEDINARPFRANEGKMELSALHFASTNPNWQPPLSTERFIARFRGRMEEDMANVKEAGLEENNLFQSIRSIVPFQSTNLRSTSQLRGDGISRHEGPLRGDGISRHEGPWRGDGISRHEGPLMADSSSSLLNSLQRSGIFLGNAAMRLDGGVGAALGLSRTETGGGEMALAALYMHQLHSRNQQPTSYGSVRGGGGGGAVSGSNVWDVPNESLFIGRGRDGQSTNESLVIGRGRDGQSIGGGRDGQLTNESLFMGRGRDGQLTNESLFIGRGRDGQQRGDRLDTLMDQSCSSARSDDDNLFSNA